MNHVRRWSVLVVLVLGMMLSSCAYYQSPVVPGMGIISSVKAPLDVDFDNTDLGAKTGTASVTSVIGFTFGDCSTNAAAKDGDIKVIKHADYKHLNVLGIFSKYTTVVYGD